LTITIPLHRVQLTPNPVNDWAKYGEPDFRKQGFTYMGHGDWLKEWEGHLSMGGGGSGVSFPYQPMIPIGMYGFYPQPMPYYPAENYESQYPARAPSPSWLKPQPAPPRLSMIKPSSRANSDDDRAKAEKLLADGDERFGKQQLSAALERYRAAAQLAPNLPGAYLRQGFALVAQKKYVPAVRMYHRSLELAADWSRSVVRLDELYGEERSRRTTQLLTQAAEADPLDADLAFLLAMQLFFTDQRDRAQLYFVRAEFLGGNQDHLLDAFLPQFKPTDDAQGR
jgi:tetratricopeptide (TPR) repeat protein